jgi:hypothetical protein
MAINSGTIGTAALRKSGYANGTGENELNWLHKTCTLYYMYVCCELLERASASDNREKLYRDTKESIWMLHD